MAEVGKGYLGSLCERLGLPAWALIGLVGLGLYLLLRKKR